MEETLCADLVRWMRPLSYGALPSLAANTPYRMVLFPL
jgi:hypothetical protein